MVRQCPRQTTDVRRRTATSRWSMIGQLPRWVWLSSTWPWTRDQGHYQRRRRAPRHSVHPRPQCLDRRGHWWPDAGPARTRQTPRRRWYTRCLSTRWTTTDTWWSSSTLDRWTWTQTSSVADAVHRVDGTACCWVQPVLHQYLNHKHTAVCSTPLAFVVSTRT